MLGSVGPLGPRVCVQGEIRPLLQSLLLICSPLSVFFFDSESFQHSSHASSTPLCLLSKIGIQNRQHATGNPFCLAHPIKKRMRYQTQTVCENRKGERETLRDNTEQYHRDKQADRHYCQRAGVDTHRVGSPGSSAAAGARSRCRPRSCLPSRSYYSNALWSTPCGTS